MSTELLTAPTDQTGLIAGSLPTFETNPGWLRNLRKKALADHRALGIPTTRDEEWKYTSLRNLTRNPIELASDEAVTADDVKAALFPVEHALQVVFVNGRFSADLSSNLPSQGALQIRTIASTLKSEPELLEKHLGRYADTKDFTFGALNSALFEDGVFIQIKRNANIGQPIHIIHLAVNCGAPTAASFPRNLILAEHGSQAFLIESYASVGEGATLSNAVTEIYLESNAQLEHIKVQQEGPKASHVALTQLKQDADCSYNGFNITFGGQLTRNDLNVFLNGSNIHSRMDGVVVLDKEQHCDNHTRLDHAFPHCDSFQVYKHVLDDHSTAVFNGKIFVYQDAQKTDAKQTNQTLLMSPTATINSKPQLEIFADDVKCTHGATIGQLRSDAMFYLRARGIPEAEARGLLVYAFVAEVLEKISNEDVKTSLETIIQSKLIVSR